VGANQDEKVVKSVIRLMHQAPYNLCGQTNLKELAAYIKSMDLFISNDSGPAHLAAALGIKTLALFGPTSSQITSPKGKKVTLFQTNVGCKIPCYDLLCKENICMKRILVTEVFEKVKELLSK
jgi:ADP-heptose:LPS heptosyltransferase